MRLPCACGCGDTTWPSNLFATLGCHGVWASRNPDRNADLLVVLKARNGAVKGTPEKEAAEAALRAMMAAIRQEAGV